LNSNFRRSPGLSSSFRVTAPQSNPRRIVITVSPGGTVFSKMPLERNPRLNSRDSVTTDASLVQTVTVQGIDLTGHAPD
jgi:hypothetical protein